MPIESPVAGLIDCCYGLSLVDLGLMTASSLPVSSDPRYCFASSFIASS